MKPQSDQELSQLLKAAETADKDEHLAAVSAAFWLGYLLNHGRVKSPAALAAFERFEEASRVAQAARKALDPHDEIDLLVIRDFTPPAALPPASDGSQDEP